MTPLDPVNPAVPGNWVRRVEERRRPKDPKGRNPDQNQHRDPNEPGRDPKHPPGQDPDGRTHIIDDLA